MQTHSILCNWKSLLIIGFFLFIITAAPAQDFTATNHAYWYQPDSPVKSKMLVWQKSPDTLGIVVSVELNNNRFLEEYRVLLHLRNQLDSATGQAPSLPLQHFRSKGMQHLLKADLPLNASVDTPLNFLLLEIRDSLQAEHVFWSYYPLEQDLNFPPPPFYISQLPDNVPLFGDYVKKETSLRIQGADTALTVFFYKRPFEIASPPMAASPTGNTELEVMSTTILSPDSVLQPRQEGLYFIQHDTTQLSGESFRYTNPYFPEIGTLQDLAGPIRYISTNEEWQAIERSGFNKKEIDRFWLKVAQNEGRAKRLIKYYYQRVSQANELFTNYKEGWKTDQGMIYILYGTPDVVAVERDREVWIYRQTADLPEIKFTFVRVKNPFTEKHFVLLRNRNYTKSHYQTVSKWRKGKNTL